MRVDRMFMVSGNRKERRAQIAAMGKKERERRINSFLLSIMFGDDDLRMDATSAKEGGLCA